MTTPTPHRPERSRLRTEGLLAASLLLFGVVVLPALIYVTGILLLGDYPGGAHVGSFYGDLLRDLAAGSGRAWTLVMGPWLLVQAGRLVFSHFGPASAGDAPSDTSAPPHTRPKADTERREPTLGM